MAFSLGGGNGHRGRGSPPLSEINVVPLVDVVLVLLIIFMLTAHVMEFGLEIKVPKVDQTRASVEDLPVVSITKAGEVYLNDKSARLRVLAADVRQRFPQSTAVYVRADGDARWDPIAQVVSALSKEKLEVRMVTQPMDEGPARRR